MGGQKKTEQKSFNVQYDFFMFAEGYTCLQAGKTRRGNLTRFFFSEGNKQREKRRKRGVWWQS